MLLVSSTIAQLCIRKFRRKESLDIKIFFNSFKKYNTWLIIVIEKL